MRGGSLPILGFVLGARCTGIGRSFDQTNWVTIRLIV